MSVSSTAFASRTGRWRALTGLAWLLRAAALLLVPATLSHLALFLLMALWAVTGLRAGARDVGGAGRG